MDVAGAPKMGMPGRLRQAELLAAAADRDTMDETWEKWNAGIEELIAGLEARSIPYVRVLLDVEEI